MAGLASVKSGFGGMTPVFTAMAALMRLAMPAAASAWPILALTAPRAQKFLSDVDLPNTFFRAANSMGSPMAVPVPCVST